SLDLTGSTFDHNWVHESLAKSDRHRSNQPYLTSGLYFDLGATNALMHHNVSWDNAGEGIRINGDGSNAIANLIYNNTLGGRPYRGIVSFNAPSAIGTKIINNIFRESIDTVPMGYAASNNVLPAVDPMFVNANRGDFHLQAGSPAIDAGIVL